MIDWERDRKCIDLCLWRTPRECYNQSTRRVQWNQDSRILSNWVAPMTHVNSKPTPPPQWGQHHSHPSNPSSSLPIEPVTVRKVKRLVSVTSLVLYGLQPIPNQESSCYLHPFFSLLKFYYHKYLYRYMYWKFLYSMLYFACFNPFSFIFSLLPMKV